MRTNVRGAAGQRDEPIHASMERRTMTNSDLPRQARNQQKDPQDWTTGDEPMTGPQASYLATLLQQAGKSEDDLDPNLTKREASELIDTLREQTGRGQGSNDNRS
jgi:Protein of unknown function (DUF3072)